MKWSYIEVKDKVSGLDFTNSKPGDVLKTMPWGSVIWKIRRRDFKRNRVWLEFVRHDSHITMEDLKKHKFDSYEEALR